MDFGPFLDTVVAVLLTAALAVTGWLIRQLFILTSATASLTAQVRDLQDDHDARIERIEAHLWERHGIIEPSRRNPPPLPIHRREPRQ